MKDSHFIQIQPQPQIVQISQLVPQASYFSIQSQSVVAQLQSLPQRQLKPDALQHDIKLGWVPRSQITGPIPLSFSSQLLDLVIESKRQSILYLGYRPGTTFELHQKFYAQGKNYPFHQFHLCKAKFLERFFKKYYSDYAFEGRRPEQIGQSAITFNSCYQGGNLDAVYYQEQQYRLLIRVDSNTLGHCNFFNFKVHSSSSGKVTFRIMNINKWKSLYQRGLRPYVKKLSRENSEFLQAGENVTFGESPLNQQFYFAKLKSLKFQFQFDQKDCQYQFCYSIPYTYSDLLAQMRKIKQKCFHIGKLCHSLSGVQVPLVTVTSPDKEQRNEPWVIAVMGRVHPSEATGSHIVNGFIKHLLTDSQEAKELRQKVLFKIVPMLNPDGVILGNTRTGVAGRDLNRQYRRNTDFVFPEISAAMDYVTKLRQKYGQKLLFVLDIHGHSSRKNSFFFGPQFSIIDQEYSKCRMLPRLYAARTDIFRYHSCKYKVASAKEATARGFFNALGIRTYTHQTSAHCFFDFTTRKDKAFTRLSLQELGKQLLLSIYDYIKLLFKDKMGTRISEEDLPKLPDEKRFQHEPQAEDSDIMSSNKDDSEEDAEDFEEKKVIQFFRKINQNKQYFYEELLATQGVEIKQRPKLPLIAVKQEKKVKKSESLKVEEFKTVNQIRQSHYIQEELVTRRNSQQKIDWANKVTYPEKKKLFQEYPKLSSVIFGSTIPESYFQRFEKSQSVRKPQQQFQAGFGSSTKYSINFIQAQFKSTAAKYPLPEPKPFKSQNSVKRDKRERKTKETFEADCNNELDTKTKERYLLLKKQLLPQLSQQSCRLNERPFDYQTVKNIPVYAMEMPQQPNLANQRDKHSKSLKVLPRKKSIRNIRESQQAQAKKISKKMKFTSLPRHLPMIGHLCFNNN